MIQAEVRRIAMPKPISLCGKDEGAVRFAIAHNGKGVIIDWVVVARLLDVLELRDACVVDKVVLFEAKRGIGWAATDYDG